MTQPIIQQIKIQTSGGTEAAATLKQVRSGLVDVDKAAKQTVSGSGALSRAQSVAGAAGGVLSTVGGSQLASVASSVIGLTTQLGAVGLVAGVAVGGLSLLNQEMERQAKISEDNANKLKSQADLIAGGATTADVTAQRDRLSTAQDFITSRITELNAYEQKLVELDEAWFDAADRQKVDDAMAGLFAEVSAVTGTQIESFADLQREIDALTSKSNDYGAQILDLNRLLVSGALDANDYAAAMAEITKNQLADAEQALRVDGMTTEARSARVAAIEREIAVLETQKQGSDLTADAVQALTDKQERLRDEYDAITSVSSTYADQLAAERAAKDALTDRNDMLIDLVDQEVEAREKLAAINQEIVQIEAERAAAATKIVNETEERRAEILAESAEEQREQAEDNARELVRIQRDANRSLRTAVGERDAYGYKQAKEAAQDRIDDQIASDEQQAKAAAKADAKALTALEKAKNQQLMTIAESAFRETNLKLTAARQQEFLVAQTQASQTFLAANGMNNVNSIHATGWQLIEGTVLTYATRIAGAVQGILGGGTPYGSSTPLTGSAADRALEARMRAIADQQMNETLIRAAGGRVATR